jgi:hypothetical protein
LRVGWNATGAHVFKLDRKVTLTEAAALATELAARPGSANPCIKLRFGRYCIKLQ